MAVRPDEPSLDMHPLSCSSKWSRLNWALQSPTKSCSCRLQCTNQYHKRAFQRLKIRHSLKDCYQTPFVGNSGVLCSQKPLPRNPSGSQWHIHPIVWHYMPWYWTLIALIRAIPGKTESMYPCRESKLAVTYRYSGVECKWLRLLKSFVVAGFRADSWCQIGH